VGYNVKILADSIAPNGKRLTTWELTYPRFVHAELMTHRLFSRNSASSRAIPTAKLMDQVKNDPAMPKWWGKNQSGMQAREELGADAITEARSLWLEARDRALGIADDLMDLGLHKQIANRLLEPWMFITVIVSATEMDNWFRLRAHPDAQPEIGWVAKEMLAQYTTRNMTATSGWHLPLISAEDYELVRPLVRELLESEGHADIRADSYAWNVIRDRLLAEVATGRCARVSYLTHDGRRDLREDIKLHDRLKESGHWSPFEHCAHAMGPRASHGELSLRWSGNFQGWQQYREIMDPNFTKVGR
jgi:thymidylate synthase ThyX